VETTIAAGLSFLSSSFSAAVAETTLQAEAVAADAVAEDATIAAATNYLDKIKYPRT